MLCYENIPLFNKNYCDLKHTDNTELVTCYRENAKLTLDKSFCDLQYPIPENPSEIQTAFDERYDCYNLIQLEGYTTKGREYCELLNPENPTNMYACIDNLIAEGIDIKKGGDYCYFKFPWAD